ncbi:cold shock domain-containing protein [Saccharopolyspora sp. NPDC050389]|uniref:cold-shock protein n=1 Tax=Saccharopolyspora sp. NPDC050389 TaxID=3155516 RepID=UPI0033F9A57B
MIAFSFLVSGIVVDVALWPSFSALEGAILRMYLLAVRKRALAVCEAEAVETGKIVKYDETRGFGFIAPDSGGEDVFLHASILDEELKQNLRGGMRVGFEAMPGTQGTKAVAVHPLGAASQAAEVADETRRGDDDELCDVLPVAEFSQQITDVLIETAPSLTGGQILQVRKRLVAFAQSNGWVEA